MARIAAAKKVAKAANTGAANKGFRINRSLLFPGAMALVVLIGIGLVFIARDQRVDEAFDANQHWYLTYDFYECDGYLNQTYMASDPEDDLPIEAEGDGLIHVQPVLGNIAGITATVGSFMSVVEAQLTDVSMELPDGRMWLESDAQCDAPDGEGEPGAELRVLRWNSVDSPLPVTFTDNLVQRGLSDNGQVVAFALVHPDVDSADIELPDTSALRLQLGLDEIGPTPNVDGGDSDGDNDDNDTDSDESDDDSGDSGDGTDDSGDGTDDPDEDEGTDDPDDGEGTDSDESDGDS